MVITGNVRGDFPDLLESVRIATKGVKGVLGLVWVHPGPCIGSLLASLALLEVRSAKKADEDDEATTAA